MDYMQCQCDWISEMRVGEDVENGLWEVVLISVNQTLRHLQNPGIQC